MRIRIATADDRAAVLALLGAQYAEHDIAIPATLASAVDQLLAQPTLGRLLLASDGDEAVGVAYLSFIWSLEHGGHSGWLDELYVVPARRGAGLGRALLLAVCDLAANEGCIAIDLEVEASHARAANLYAREGFRPHQRARWVKTLRETR